MKIGKDNMVSIHYTLRDEAGEIIDSSRDHNPLDYIQGAGQIVPGMEKALEGKNSGDEMSVVVEPEEGYGRRDESLVHKVSKKEFQGIDKIETGMCFQVNAGDGPILMNVAAVEEDEVVLDGNHPLADMRLFFEISIVNVRETSEEELNAGQDGPVCDCC